MIFQSYLKTLKKKQKEVTQKHQRSEGGISTITGDSENKHAIDLKDNLEKNRGS